MSSNPYAAPVAEVADVVAEGEFVKSGRGTRLGAAIVDNLIFMAVAFPLIFAISAISSPGVLPEFGNTALVLSGFALLSVITVNLVMLYRHGQTIGKKLLDIRIAMVDGSRAGLARIIFLRVLVITLLGMIPLVGVFVSLADALFIFGEQRRCLHDYIAGTIVINA